MLVSGRDLLLWVGIIAVVFVVIFYGLYEHGGLSVVVALAGMGASLWCVQDSYALVRTGRILGGPHYVLANGHLRNELLRLVLFLTTIYLHIVHGTWWRGHPEFFHSLFITCILAYGSFRDFQERKLVKLLLKRY